MDQKLEQPNQKLEQQNRSSTNRSWTSISVRRSSTYRVRNSTSEWKVNDALMIDYLKTMTRTSKRWIRSLEGSRTELQSVKTDVELKSEDKHNIRSLVGLCTHYHRLVKGFAHVTRPLHTLTNDKMPLHWIDAPVLSLPQYDQPFIMDTDSCNTGLRGVLLQIQYSHERVMVYVSQVLTKAFRAKISWHWL